MPERTSSRIPKYRLHKPTDRAVVRLNGRDIYLGRHGSDESRRRYRQVIAEWLGNNRQVAARREFLESPQALAVAELVGAYLRYAKGYYRKNGKPSGEVENIKDAIQHLVPMYAKTLAADFGPTELRAVRRCMVDANLCRNVVNARVNRIRRIFKWAVGNQFVSTTVLQALQAVEALKRGRSPARETDPVQPAPDENIDEVLKQVPRQVAAMIQLQRLTGMRPGEATAMRTGDLDITGTIWVYKPGSHKTEHHGRSTIKPIIGPTRPRAVKWYCPFASQCGFPSGHRYCINVYTGCSHRCVYCYAASYAPENASAKQRFERLVTMDMEDLERFDVPPAPVHLSNSTDPFQPLEEKHGHTRFAMEQILEHRDRFTTVTILTKNPLRPVQLGYVELFKALGRLSRSHPHFEGFSRKRRPAFVVEASVAFWREPARYAYDPGAPSIEDRVEGLRTLHAAGIPLVIRIDPLFPSNPLTNDRKRTFGDFELEEPQTFDDLTRLVALAKELNVRHVVYSPAKITQPRGRKMSPTMQAMRRAYEAVASPDKLVFRGGSWRVPQAVAHERIVRPFLEICKRYRVRAKYCKQNLTETP